MIIKGRSTGGAGRIAAHVQSGENERVEVKELRGVMTDNLCAALRQMETAAKCTAARKALYHASINPRAGENLTNEQWVRAIDRLEAGLGLAGQPRAVVAHVKDGREHRHVIWSRIDLARGRVISDSHNFRKHEEAARDLEREFGFPQVPGAHVERQGRKRPARTPSHAEMQQGKRTGIDPREARATITALWNGATTGKEFSDALTKAGWTLARGDRRDFVLIDPKGGVHSLARRIDGATAKDIRARMADIEPASLPGVQAVRATIRARPRPCARSTARATRMDVVIPFSKRATRPRGVSHRGPRAKATTQPSQATARPFPRPPWHAPFKATGGHPPHRGQRPQRQAA